MRDSTIATFYTPELNCSSVGNSVSKSPSKPAKVLQILNDIGVGSCIDVKPFLPFVRCDILLAHTKEYVDAFLTGKHRLSTSNSIPWSSELVSSVLHTNASLYYAQLHALLNPQTICFSPTSGFHHAQPARGHAFCTFSGQVISALKLYKEFGVSGLWIDLDAHFGNSIEDSRLSCPDLNNAIPEGANVNPIGTHEEYLLDLSEKLEAQEEKILSGELTWIAFAQGADSHEGDHIGGQGQLTTEEWLRASAMVYKWIATMDERLGRPIPLTLSLFGGYRDDDYESVLHLHVANLVTALRELVDSSYQFATIT